MGYKNRLKSPKNRAKAAEPAKINGVLQTLLISCSAGSTQANPVIIGNNRDQFAQSSDNYAQAVSLTLQMVTDAAYQVTAPLADLCFDYIHMNNNRLGMLPVEEAYLAALLRQLVASHL